MRISDWSSDVCSSDLGEGVSLLFHGGEDIIAGAIQYAVDAADRIGGRAFAQALDDRDASCNSCFIFQGDGRFLRLPGQVNAMMRDHRLVGGDERLARGKALSRKGKGGAEIGRAHV